MTEKNIKEIMENNHDIHNTDNKIFIPFVDLLYADTPCLNNRIYPMKEVLKLVQDETLHIPLFIGFQKETKPRLENAIGYVKDLCIEDNVLAGSAMIFKDRVPEGVDISLLLEGCVIRTCLTARINRDTPDGIDAVFDVNRGSTGHCAMISIDEDAFNKTLLEKFGYSISAKGKKVDDGNNPVQSEKI